MVKSGDIVQWNSIGATLQVGVVLRKYTSEGAGYIEVEDIDSTLHVLKVSDICVLESLKSCSVSVPESCNQLIDNILCTIEEGGVDMRDALIYIFREDVDEFRLVVNGVMLVSVPGYGDIKVSDDLIYDNLFCKSIEGLLSHMVASKNELLILPSRHSYIRVDNALMFCEYEKYRNWIEYITLSHARVVVSSIKESGGMPLHSTAVMGAKWKTDNSRVILDPATPDNVFSDSCYELGVPYDHYLSETEWVSTRSILERSFIGINKKNGTAVFVNIIY